MKKYQDTVKISIPQVTAILTERILKMVELLDANIDIGIKLKMIKRELDQSKYEGFKVCQILPKEFLGKRTKAYIYKPKWCFWRGKQK